MPLRKPILCEFILKTIGNDIFFIELDDILKYLDGAFDLKRYDIPLLLSKTWKLEEPVLIATKTWQRFKKLEREQSRKRRRKVRERQT